MMVLVLLPFLENSGLQILRAEVTIVSKKVRPKMRDTGFRLAFIYVCLTILDTVALKLAGMSFFDSVNHAFTTLSTGGFSPHGMSIEGYKNPWVEIITIAFMFMGGASFYLHFRLMRHGDWKSYYRSSEIRLYVTIVILFMAVSTLSRVMDNPDLSVLTALRQGAFLGLSLVTTTGYTSTGYSTWPVILLILIVMLMFAGGCIGSTGGSIKMRRLLMLGKVILREIEQVLHPNRVMKIKIDDEVVDEAVVRKVVAFVVIWLFLFLAMALFLACFGHSMVTCISGAASCLGNVGSGIRQRHGGLCGYGGLRKDHSHAGYAHRTIRNL